MKFGDICSNNEVVLKRSEISVADSHRYCSYYCGLWSTFIMEGKDTF